MSKLNNLWILAAAVGISACDESSVASTAASSSSTDALSSATAGSTADLTVGKYAHVVFDLETSSRVVKVYVADRDVPPQVFEADDRPPHGLDGMGGDPAEVSVRPELGSVTGTVNDIGGSSLTIAGVVVNIDADTRYRGAISSLEDLSAGEVAHVFGEISSADGSFVARVVAARGAMITGKISAVSEDATTITVLGRAITLDAETEIFTIPVPEHFGRGRGRGHRMGHH